MFRLHQIVTVWALAVSPAGKGKGTLMLLVLVCNVLNTGRKEIDESAKIDNCMCGVCTAIMPTPHTTVR